MDAITDPAWFYSSLAQSAASIVGIVGAVFLARLTDHRERMLNTAWQLADKLMQHGATFTDTARRYTDAADLAKQQPPIPPVDHPVLAAAAAALSRLKGRVEPKRMARIERRLAECERQAAGHWTQSVLHQNAQHLGTLRREVESFRARALPGALIAVWVLLAWLSVFGVIWPLAVLPALPQIAASKGLILAVFGLGVLGFVMFLAYELWQLRRLGQFDWRKG